MIENNTIDQPLISVVIPTYNRAYCIAKTVNSVIRQTYRNWELIIVDNSSTDATRKVLISYLHNSRILYIYQENLSSSESINYGIKCARGKYIALLDDDDEFKENKLSVQLSEMRTHDADFSLSNCIKVYDGRNASPTYYPNSYVISRKDLLQGRFHLSHTHMMFKTSIKEDCWFDPSLPASDDFDLLARIVSKYRVLFVREPLAYINKSVKRPRISNDPHMKIRTIEQLIKRIKTYDWTDEEKQRVTNLLTMRLGFWQMMAKEYKLGRHSMSEMMAHLPFVKRTKYELIYFLSYVPPAFEVTKLIAEHLWRLSAGRIKV